MRVSVRLVGDLERFLARSGGGLAVELPFGATPIDLCRVLQVPEGEVWRVSVNGEIRPDSWPLREGDEVLVLPPLGGG